MPDQRADGFSQFQRAKEEIASLPGWARVAVVARCAERALPLLTLRENTNAIPSASQNAVRHAVEFARRAALAAQPARAEDAEAAFSVSRRARPAADRAASAAGSDNAAYAQAAHLYCGAFAASAAGAAAQAASGSGADLEVCKNALSTSHDAIHYLSGAAADCVGAAALDDISWLQSQPQSDSSTIPEGFFRRQLWSLGEPEGWADRITKAGGLVPSSATPPSVQSKPTPQPQGQTEQAHEHTNMANSRDACLATLRQLETVVTESETGLSIPGQQFLKSCSPQEAEMYVSHILQIMEKIDSSEEYWKLCNCLDGLEILGKYAHAAVEAIASPKYLKDSREAIRHSAVRILYEIGPAAKAASPALLEALNDSYDSVRKYASKALERIRGVAPSLAPPRDPAEATSKTSETASNSQPAPIVTDAELIFDLDWDVDARGNNTKLNLPISDPSLLSARNRDGQTALHRAAFEGRINLVQALAAKGAQVNATNRSRYTPLHMAAMQGHKAIIDFLLLQGADPAARTQEGYTALELASQCPWGKAAADLLRAPHQPSPEKSDEPRKPWWKFW